MTINNEHLEYIRAKAAAKAAALITLEAATKRLHEHKQNARAATEARQEAERKVSEEPWSGSTDEEWDRYIRTTAALLAAQVGEQATEANRRIAELEWKRAAHQAEKKGWSIEEMRERGLI